MAMTATAASSADGAPAPAVDEAPARAHGRWRFALVVGAAVVVGLALRIAIGLTDDAPSTDETAYLRSGISLAEGDGFDRAPGRAELHFPPFVPFLMGMAHRVLDDPHNGAVAITCLASAALVVPLALLARQAAGDRAGMITAGLAAVVPGLSTTYVTSGGGSEAVYALVLVLAVWCVVSAANREGWRRLARVAAAGLLVGFAYLTRPEGLFLSAPLLLAAVVPVLRGLRPRRADVVPALRAATPLAVVFAVPLLLCVVPYAAFLHTHTGSWQLSAKTQDASIEAWRAVAENDREARDRELYALDETGLQLHDDYSSLPALAKDDPGAYAGIIGTNVVTLFESLASPASGRWWTWRLLPLPLWGLAALGAWRLRTSHTVRLLLAVAALPVATALVFFVQVRYLLVVVAPATVCLGVAAATLSDRWRRPVVAGSAALLALSSLFAFEGGGGWWHPPDHLSYRQAGEWIAENAGADERIMARSMVVELYAERPTVAIPYGTYDEIMAYARHYGVNYLVLDPSTAHRLRPQLSFLRVVDNAPGLELVANIEVEGQVTRIFRLDPAPPPGAPMGPSLGFVGDASA